MNKKDQKFDICVQPLKCPVCAEEILSTTEYNNHISEHLCGYGNCFRPFYKMRGFMPCCKLHYEHPQKWPTDKNGNPVYTGSVFRKRVPNKEMEKKL